MGLCHPTPSLKIQTEVRMGLCLLRDLMMRISPLSKWTHIGCEKIFNCDWNSLDK